MPPGSPGAVYAVVIATEAHDRLDYWGTYEKGMSCLLDAKHRLRWPADEAKQLKQLQLEQRDVVIFDARRFVHAGMRANPALLFMP